MPADSPAGERPTGTLEPRLPGLAHPNRVLITAGPTHEPIDAVRFLGNRSSGRMGIEIAQAFARTGAGEPNTAGRAITDKGKERPTGRPERPEPAGAREVRLLLGPTSLTPTDTRVQVFRFQSTAELQTLLGQQFSWCDVLVMAAAVADFRPKGGPLGTGQKLRRDPTGLKLELEPTPDLLAEVAQRRRSDQLLVGFALEPRDRLIMSAREKLARKNLDLIVANELETMDAPDVSATVLDRHGGAWPTPGKLDKRAFAELLVERLDEAWRALQSAS